MMRSLPDRLWLEAEALWHLSYTGDRPDLTEKDVDSIRELIAEAARALQSSGVHREGTDG